MDHTQAQFKTIQFDFPSIRQSMYPRPTQSPTLRLLQEQVKKGIQLTYVIDPEAPHSFIPKDNARLCTRPLLVSILNQNEDSQWEVLPIKPDEMFFILDQSYLSLHIINSYTTEVLARFGFHLTSSKNQTQDTVNAHRGLQHHEFAWLHYKEGLRDLEQRIKYARSAVEHAREGIVGRDDNRNPTLRAGIIEIDAEQYNFRTIEGFLPLRMRR